MHFSSDLIRSSTFTPSPFDNPQTYLRLDGRYVESISEPEQKISLFNIVLVSLASIFTLGLALLATGDKWWYKRTCKIRHLDIRLYQSMPQSYIHTTSLLMPHQRFLAELTKKIECKGWRIPRKRLAQSSSHTSDSYCFAFIEAMKKQADQHLPQLSFNQVQVLTEQIALDAICPVTKTRKSDFKRQLNNKIDMVASLHELKVEKKVPLLSLRAMQAELTAIRTAYIDKPDPHYYCLTSQDTSGADHILMIFFQYQKKYYAFDPAQGIFQLASQSPNGKSPEELFAAYAQIQLSPATQKNFALVKLSNEFKK